MSPRSPSTAASAADPAGTTPEPEPRSRPRPRCRAPRPSAADQQRQVERDRAAPRPPGTARPAGAARSSAPPSAPRRHGRRLQHLRRGRCGRPAPRPPAACRTRSPSGTSPCQHRRQRRLVQLQHDPRVRQPAGHVGDVPADALGQRLDQVAGRAGVGDGLVAVVQLDRGGERPRAGDLQLQRPGVVLGEVLESVEVAGEEVERAPQVPARRGRPAASRTAAGRPAGRRGTRVPRPIMSAPAPRAGSSGTCGRSGSSPSTVLVASAGSVPGIDPTPVATPASCCSVTAATLAPRGIVGARRQHDRHVRGTRAGGRPGRPPALLLDAADRRVRDGAAGRLPRPDVDRRRAGRRRSGHRRDPLPSCRPGSRSRRCGSGPGAAPAVLGLPASALRDQRVPLAELWPDAPALAAGSAARPTGSRCWRTRSAGGSPTRRPSTRSPSPSAAGWPADRVGRAWSRSWRGGPGCPSGSCTAGA